MTGMYTGPATRGTGLGLLAPAQTVDIDLAHPLGDIAGLENYPTVLALVRYRRTPVGSLILPVKGGRVLRQDVASATAERLRLELLQCMIRHHLEGPLPAQGMSLDQLWHCPPSPSACTSMPLVTVAVCTRDRPDDLFLCLRSLERLDYPHLDVLVVDNSPSSDDTARLMKDHFPAVRYIVEPRAGLDWARNCAIEQAVGDLIAFTDDDVIVDPLWVASLAAVFQADPTVMAVTGLIVPHELETEPQILFEVAGGFGRGFRRAWHRRNSLRPDHIGSGQFGAGANMAFRRALFDRIGRFDPALDVGTPTDGGGDLEMFFRIIQEGHTLVYEPSAIVRHRHRRSYGEVREQLGTWGTAVSAYLIRCSAAYPRMAAAIAKYYWWWVYWGYVRPLLAGLLYPRRFPSDLLLTPFLRLWTGPLRYWRSARASTRAGARSNDTPKRSRRSPPADDRRKLGATAPVALRTVNLTGVIEAIDDVAEYAVTRVYVNLGVQSLGYVQVANHFCSISPARLRDLIAGAFAGRLLQSFAQLGERVPVDAFAADLISRFTTQDEVSPSETADPLISIVVATLDRPASLRRCLQSLQRQTLHARAEIIVVDNNPSSGLTPPVVAEFPGSILISEEIRGLARARNAGIRVSRGSIIATTDDDVVAPQGWLERLTEPFERRDVSAVTGNVLPSALNTVAEHRFEAYGGLGRGFLRAELGPDWFASHGLRPPPMWKVGATANSAFRREIFDDADIGWLDEALGPGTPTGVGEDCYLLYRIVKAGHTILYEPNAYVFHAHRSDMAALKRQVYNYSKGHVAYLLTTLTRDGDTRALWRLLAVLPWWHSVRLLGLTNNSSFYPRSLVWREVLGYLAGPFAWYRARRRVRRYDAVCHHSERTVPDSRLS